MLVSCPLLWSLKPISKCFLALLQEPCCRTHIQTDGGKHWRDTLRLYKETYFHNNFQLCCWIHSFLLSQFKLLCLPQTDLDLMVFCEWKRERFFIKVCHFINVDTAAQRCPMTWSKLCHPQTAYSMFTKGNSYWTRAVRTTGPLGRSVRRPKAQSVPFPCELSGSGPQPHTWKHWECRQIQRFSPNAGPYN